MSWVKLDDQFPLHPKVVDAGAHAAWLYISGLCYSAAQLTDGRIPKALVPRLTELAGPARLAARLVDVGLWDDQGDAYLIHDYDHYNPPADKVLEERRTRNEVKAAAGRAGGLASGKQRRSRSEAHDEAEAKQTASETEAPSPSLPVTSPPPLTLAVGNRRPVVVDEAISLIVDREHALAPPGSISNSNGWKRTVGERVRVEHGAQLHRLAHEHPEWTASQLADALAAPPAPPRRQRVCCAECTQDTSGLTACPLPELALDCPTFTQAEAM